MQVDVAEGVGLDRLEDLAERRMGGEADVPHPPLGLPALGHLQTAAGAQRVFEQLAVVDAVNAEQLDALTPLGQAQTLHAGE